MTNTHILSVNKAGECINVEIGHEEEASTAMLNEIGQLAYQLLQQVMYVPTKKRITKAVICLTEEEYEMLKPAVGDEVEVEVKNDSITFKFIK